MTADMNRAIVALLIGLVVAAVEKGATVSSVNAGLVSSERCSRLSFSEECRGCFAASGIPVINSIPGLTLTFTTEGTNGTCIEENAICKQWTPCVLGVSVSITNNTGGSVYLYSPNTNSIVGNGGTLETTIKFGNEGDVACGDLDNELIVEAESGLALSINMLCDECSFN